VEFCLKEAGVQAGDLDYVGFYEKPLLKFDRLLQTYLSYAPRGFRSFARAIPQWINEKLHIPSLLREELPGYRKRFVFASHHESHAASAFFPSPFDESAILTVDGVGEWTTAAFGTGQGRRIELSHEIRFPHSLGLLYTAFTSFCGFKVNSGEYKLMGLAPFGTPRYFDLILERIIDLKTDGSFRLHLEYFNYCQGLTMTSAKFHKLFGGPPRRPETALTQRELDLAASIQQVTEEVLLRMGRHVHRQTGMSRLCLAGGVALNCVANGRLLREGPFDSIWIQPAAGDAGGALGVALFIWHQLLGKSRSAIPGDAMHGSLLGPGLERSEIQAALEARQAVWTESECEEQMCRAVAQLLAEGRVVGWVQDRMEFGPRALGNRSILGDPRSPGMQSAINIKTKFRESFRPFAPAILREQTNDYFDLPDEVESPYMLLVTSVAAARRIPVTLPAGQSLHDRVQQIRSEIPAVTHVDHSARVQTVDAQRFPRFHKLLSEFQRQTNCPLLINTSFNVRGEPIVCSADDAYRCFMATNMDALAIGNFLLLKDQQQQVQPPRDRQYPHALALD
jgi:carbamoyltransferase